MCNVCKTNTGKISLTDLVNEIFLNKGDVGRREYLRYKSIAKGVYRELNLLKLREAVRVFISIDKATNSIRIPENCISISSISVVDSCNKLVPLSYTDSITDQDIISINDDKKCGCKVCDCQNKDCGSMYKYETMTELVSMKLPNGSFDTFEKTLIKRINPDGSVVQEINEPELTFDDNGVHVSTDMVKRIEVICKVDVKDCGCIIDSEENKKKLGETCCAQLFSVESGCCAKNCGCETLDYSYSMNEEQNRMYFDTRFAYDKVLLRYYANQTSAEIEIPIIAKDAVMYGTEYKAAMWDKNSKGSRAGNFKMEYYEAVSNLEKAMYRMTNKEFIDTVLPYRNTANF